MKRRATLKDVAEAAGVHLSTVSRALNPRTRAPAHAGGGGAFSAISRSLDYRPNAAAHSLRTNRTRTIGIVVPDITNPVFPPIIRGIEDALAKRGYLAILANTDGRLDQEAEIAELLRARGVDGLVLASVEREDKAVLRLAAEGLPIVTVNRRVDDPVCLFRRQRRGVRHPRRAEPPRVARPQARSPTSPVRRRCRPASSAIAPSSAHRRALGLDGDSGADSRSPPASTKRKATRRTEEILGRRAGVHRHRLRQRPARDRRDRGAPRGMGSTAQRDISVTGYNDMPLVDRLSPALTTVRIQQYEVGLEAADILVDLIETPAEERRPQHRVRPTKLVVRDSTASPKRARR